MPGKDYRVRIVYQFIDKARKQMDKAKERMGGLTTQAKRFGEQNERLSRTGRKVSSSLGSMSGQANQLWVRFSAMAPAVGHLTNRLKMLGLIGVGTIASMFVGLPRVEMGFKYFRTEVERLLSTLFGPGASEALKTLGKMAEDLRKWVDAHPGIKKLTNTIAYFLTIMAALAVVIAAFWIPLKFLTKGFWIVASAISRATSAVLAFIGITGVIFLIRLAAVIAILWLVNYVMEKTFGVGLLDLLDAAGRALFGFAKIAVAAGTITLRVLQNLRDSIGTFLAGILTGDLQMIREGIENAFTIDWKDIWDEAESIMERDFYKEFKSDLSSTFDSVKDYGIEKISDLASAGGEKLKEMLSTLKESDAIEDFKAKLSELGLSMKDTIGDLIDSLDLLGEAGEESAKKTANAWEETRKKMAKFQYEQDVQTAKALGFGLGRWGAEKKPTTAEIYQRVLGGNLREMLEDPGMAASAIANLFYTNIGQGYKLLARAAREKGITELPQGAIEDLKSYYFEDIYGRRGGIPEFWKQFIGTRQFGGIIPREGMYYLHAGERVLPREGAKATNIGVSINIENMTSNVDIHKLAHRVSRRIADEIG